MSIDAYRAELVWAITGEIFGKALFKTAAQIAEDQNVSKKFASLARLEEVTLGRLLPLAQKYGLAFDENTHIAKGKERGERLGRCDWRESMTMFSEAVGEDIERMEALAAMAPAEDRPALQFLIAHEKALASFALKELNNEASALADIESLIHS